MANHCLYVPLSPSLSATDVTDSPTGTSGSIKYHRTSLKFTPHLAYMLVNAGYTQQSVVRHCSMQQNAPAMVSDSHISVSVLAKLGIVAGM